jgi:hypothetical protein
MRLDPVHWPTRVQGVALPLVFVMYVLASIVGSRGGPLVIGWCVIAMALFGARRRLVRSLRLLVAGRPVVVPGRAAKVTQRPEAGRRDMTPESESATFQRNRDPLALATTFRLAVSLGAELDLFLFWRLLEGRLELHACTTHAPVGTFRHPRSGQAIVARPLVARPFAVVPPASRSMLVPTESPEQVVRIERPPAVDHHQLDGVPEAHDEPVEGQVALTVVLKNGPASWFHGPSLAGYRSAADDLVRSHPMDPTSVQSGHRVFAGH